MQKYKTMYYVIVTSKSLMANDYSNKIVGCYKTMAEAKTTARYYAELTAESVVGEVAAAFR